ncbi:hypothetical protein [Motilimonas pumila]|uniref:Uncharacterized protein n=1 Tax=Motilimonas pumila TaxID=2303987 RepID=A0A418YBM1_9GAMM|nr:hypothetical protein [Motilimonas pumila]RJG41878.1 hypothetical protein D1Z90_16060 [Motilimonas pumila]
MKQGCYKQWTRYLIVSLLVKLVLPFYVGATTLTSSEHSLVDPDEKILLCTATGFKWVSVSELYANSDKLTSSSSDSKLPESGTNPKIPHGGELSDVHGTSPFSKFKCALCVPGADLNAYQLNQLGYQAKLRIQHIQPRWFSSSLHYQTHYHWNSPPLRAPPSSFLAPASLF